MKEKPVREAVRCDVSAASTPFFLHLGAAPGRLAGGAKIGGVTSAIEQALAQDRIIDITTTGRKTGEARRIEIWFHRLDGRYYITGTPGARGWYANLLEHPDFTFHLKESAQADLPARATPVTGAEKTRVLEAIAASIVASMPGRTVTFDSETSPLVEVTLDVPAA
jgi:deazaflavin-dependent oxidoreductase (nitroreductase family)